MEFYLNKNKMNGQNEKCCSLLFNYAILLCVQSWARVHYLFSRIRMHCHIQQRIKICEGYKLLGKRWKCCDSILCCSLTTLIAVECLPCSALIFIYLHRSTHMHYSAPQNTFYCLFDDKMTMNEFLARVNWSDFMFRFVFH